MPCFGVDGCIHLRAVESVASFDVDSIKIDRGKIADASSVSGWFKRYALTDDGILPGSCLG